MRVMLDNSIFAHSQFAEAAKGPQGPCFGAKNQHHLVCGFIRKKLDPSIEYQAQKDALFTIGRLIREKAFEAFTYQELMYEKMRRTIGENVFDALDGCRLTRCPPAIERSRFQMGNFFEFARKGGKKDQKRDAKTELGQIAFMKMLCSLDEGGIRCILGMKAVLGLPDFEVESFRELKCFQGLCAISQSPEHYPDMFHLWTTQRNHIDVFLTLEKKLPEIAKTIENSRKIKVGYPTRVLRPLQFLESLGVTNADPVPIEPGRFYPFIEVWDSWYRSHRYVEEQPTDSTALRD